MSANDEWTPKMTCVMILGCGLDSSLLIDPTQYDSDDDGTPCTAENVGETGYLEEDMIADHVRDRAAVFRMLRYAQTKGFTKMLELWTANETQTHGTVNHGFLALTEELFAVCTPEELLDYAMQFE